MRVFTVFMLGRGRSCNVRVAGVAIDQISVSMSPLHPGHRCVYRENLIKTIIEPRVRLRPGGAAAGENGPVLSPSSSRAEQTLQTVSRLGKYNIFMKLSWEAAYRYNT